MLPANQTVPGPSPCPAAFVAEEQVENPVEDLPAEFPGPLLGHDNANLVAAFFGRHLNHAFAEMSYPGPWIAFAIKVGQHLLNLVGIPRSITSLVRRQTAEQLDIGAVDLDVARFKASRDEASIATSSTTAMCGSRGRARTSADCGRSSCGTFASSRRIFSKSLRTFFVQRVVSRQDLRVATSRRRADYSIRARRPATNCPNAESFSACHQLLLHLLSAR